MAEKNTTAQWDMPTEADNDLVGFVVSHTDRWRDHRDENFLQDWLEYERIFRGVWEASDKTRDSERSRIISPATQQAVETRHAEIMEAIFGSGEYFDISDDINDIDGNPMDVEKMKLQLQEDMTNKGKIRKAIDQIELMAEIYGTGVCELVVKQEKELTPTTQQIPGSNQAAYGVTESDYFCVKYVPVNPKNFLIDPNATQIGRAHV